MRVRDGWLLVGVGWASGLVMGFGIAALFCLSGWIGS